MTKKAFLVTSRSGVVTPDGVFYPTGSTVIQAPKAMSQLLENGSVTRINRSIPKQTDNRSFVWRGEWQYGVSYCVNDGVSFNSLNYIAIGPNTDKMPPSSQWQRIK